VNFSPDPEFMNFQIEKCIVANQDFSMDQVRELLQYKHVMTCCLLDLQLLDEEAGADTFIPSSLSGKEMALLSTFTSAKRKREWLGGRFAAKYATARLLEQIESLDNDMDWSGHVILADENGRPYLSANTENPAQSCDISISHSESMAAAMAVNKGYCGIDIQKITPKVIKLMGRFCSPEEKEILQDFFPFGPDEQAAPLTKLWAAKESLRKVSAMASLPGFLELKLIEIITDPSQENAGLQGFVFTWKNPDTSAHKHCRVAVTYREDYALALTARDDTMG
jgi:phosphopantetheinyl transferase (holo-ACP synthase)